MKKQAMPDVKEIPVKEVVAYTHRGIVVMVEIDYQNGTITLVDRDLKRKQWLFAKREIQYMQGWKTILSAMDNAITRAAVKLESYQQERLNEGLRMYLDANPFDYSEEYKEVK
jgi:hypothetical protein